jgi:enterochelin esterase-like enzyme
MVACDTLPAMSRILVFAALLFSIGASAQGPVATTTPPPLMSHQVNPDRTITFRYAAPSASAVLVGIDAYPKPLPMTKDAAGIWSVTTPVLPPEYYGYGFVEDGVAKLDPLNSNTLQNYVSLGDAVLIPGRPAEPWELTSLPHGRVDHTFYTTHVAKHLPENQEPYVVYTPPGYDPRHKGGYPVLYLLHGWSDTETGWTANGHADLILDRLMAEGKAVPMIIVMPLGYGDLEFVEHGFGVWKEPAKIGENLEPYSKMLLTEILPAVESSYNVAPGRENRAIAGLSMGGLESLTIGLNHPEEFAYVGGMSSAIFGSDKAGDEAVFEADIPKLEAKSAKLRLLWVGCGKADGLIRANRDFVAWTKAKGFDTVAVETEGAHTWLTWRDNLVQLAPLLFRSK